MQNLYRGIVLSVITSCWCILSLWLLSKVWQMTYQRVKNWILVSVKHFTGEYPNDQHPHIFHSLMTFSTTLDQPWAWYIMFTTLLMQIDTAIIWASLIADSQISACPTDAVIAFVSCVRLWKCHGCLAFHGPIHNIKHFIARYFARFR